MRDDKIKQPVKESYHKHPAYGKPTLEVNELKALRLEVIEKMGLLLDKVEAEKRVMTDEENKI